MNSVVDAFTKMDGGVRYGKLLKHIEKLERRANKDRQALYELTIIREFARIVANIK
jgi:hypothetical protein